MTTKLPFTLEAQSSTHRARAGRFQTLHGEVLTPLFMPVATNAAVRGQEMQTVESAGSQVLLANTFHLLLRPGPDVFRHFGGIHRFMNWTHGILTDSGGFQIFSLARKLRIEEHGASFQSPIDGTPIELTPEHSIAMQTAIGSDIMMVLDECIPSTSPHDHAHAAMERTTRWAKRSLAARSSDQALFGIIQGACFTDLRTQSVEQICALPFDGFAIGGLAVGEGKHEREAITEHCTERLPPTHPRYLMGVGTPLDLVEAVARGVDMFDCILPTALAQQGVAFTSSGRIDLRRSRYKTSDTPLDSSCICATCSRHSRAYLHHLIKAKEPYGWLLIGQHNLTFFHDLMGSLRQAILNDSFAPLYRSLQHSLALHDGEIPPTERAQATFRIIEQKGHAHIQHIPSLEIMHPGDDPLREANELYIAQSDLSDRLLKSVADDLIIWDVGLGCATNAMALIRALDSYSPNRAQQCLSSNEQIARGARKIRLISFEQDLAPAQLALEQPTRFPFLNRSSLTTLLRDHSWCDPISNIEWSLMLGDFCDLHSAAAAPELIYFDPFSPKCDAQMWNRTLFTSMRARCRADAPATLITYSRSTMVRAELLAAGWYVAAGVPSGAKSETTRAYSHAPREAVNLLPSKWLHRIIASDQSLERTTLYHELQAHPQFTQGP